jgi:hypothetical protein
MHEILILRMLRKILIAQEYGNCSLVEEAAAVINGEPYDKCSTCVFYGERDDICGAVECVKDHLA